MNHELAEGRERMLATMREYEQALREHVDELTRNGTNMNTADLKHELKMVRGEGRRVQQAHEIVRRTPL